MTAPGGAGRFAPQQAAGSQPIRSLPDPAYGEASTFREQQQGAPMSAGAASAAPQAPFPSDLARMVSRAAGAPTSANAAPGIEPQALPPLPGLFDPGDPSVPMTSGAPLGAGPNTIAGLPGSEPDPSTLTQALEPYYAADATGTLAALANHLSERGLW